MAEAYLDNLRGERNWARLPGTDLYMVDMDGNEDFSPASCNRPRTGVDKLDYYAVKDGGKFKLICADDKRVRSALAAYGVSHLEGSFDKIRLYYEARLGIFDDYEKKLAIKSLVMDGDKLMTSLILERLKTETNESIFTRMAEIISRSDDPRAKDVLFSRLKDEGSSFIRSSAARWLVAGKFLTKADLPKLLEIFDKEGVASVKSFLMEGIRTVADRSMVPFFMENLKRINDYCYFPHNDIRAVSMTALWDLVPASEMEPMLYDILLNDPCDTVRRVAADILRNSANDRTPVVLREALNKETSPDACDSILRSIHKVCGPDAKDALLGYLYSGISDSFTGGTALDSLAVIGKKDGSVAEALFALYDVTGEVWLKFHIIRALGHIGGPVAALMLAGIATNAGEETQFGREANWELFEMRRLKKLD